MDASGTVVGVVGARGGVGATTLAAALAHRLAADGTHRVGHDGAPDVALVDLDGAGAGIDVHLGVEEVTGLRWPDLSDARGDVAGDELAALLPTWAGVAVLSGDRWRPGPAPPDVVADVLDALVASHRVVVVDLGRREVLDAAPALRRCGTVLVVGARDVVSVAGLLALRGRLVDAVTDVRLVVGGRAPGGLGVLEVAHVVDLPVAATVPVDRRLAALVERGAGPAVGARGALGRCVTRLAHALAAPASEGGPGDRAGRQRGAARGPGDGGGAP